jgi:hypothetical protein
LLLGAAPFAHFMALSDWLYARTGQTHAIAQDRMVLLLREHLHARGDFDGAEVDRALIADYRAGGGRRHFDFEDAASAAAQRATASLNTTATPARQARHLRGA